MESTKVKTFKVRPVTPLNNETYLVCCYKDAETQQMVWLTDAYTVGKGERMPDKGVLMLKFSTSFKFHEIRIETNAHTKMKEKALAQIEFFRSFPQLSQSLNNGTVNSFPSRNHQLTFSNVWQEGSNGSEALSYNDQPFTFVDEEALEEQTLQDNRRRRTVARLIDSIVDNVGEMTNICYVIGINPNGLGKDGIELALTKAVLDGDKENDFVAAMEQGKHKNAFLLYTHVAIVRGLVPKSESGFYQFKGEPIAKTAKEVSLHFQNVEFDWTELKLKLKEIGVNVNESDEKGSPKAKGAAKAPVSEEV